MKNSEFKRYLKMIRPFDWIIVGLLLIGAFIPYGIFAYKEHQQNTQPQNVLTAYVSHDGKQVYKVQLTNHEGKTTYRYNDEHDWNVIEVTDNKIAITEANCPDQVCVRRGQISKAGETIVCLPHKLLVEIKSSTNKPDDGGLVTE